MSENRTLLDALIGDDEWRRHQMLEHLRIEGASPEQLDAARACLVDGDASERAAARMALTAAAADGSPSAEPARRILFDALTSDDADLRVIAASSLGETATAAVVEPLTRALHDPSPNVIAAAADALGELGDPAALEPLVALLDSDERWVRAAAVVALGRLRDARAIPALSRATDSPGLEGPLIEALALIGGSGALPVLEKLARRAPGGALRAAGAILCTAPEAPVPEWVRAGALEHEAELLGRLEEEDDPAVARLLGIAATPAALARMVALVGPPRRSEAALAGLLAAPPAPRAAALLSRIRDAEGEELVMLLSILPPIEHPERAATLSDLLTHTAADVRGAAAEALARAPADHALPLLTRALQRKGATPEVVRALGGLGGAGCVALVPFMTDSSAAVRTAAAEALTRCADRSVLADIEAALESESWPETRRALLRALGRAGGPLAPQVSALDDPDMETRIAAIEGLAATRSLAAVPYLRRALGGPEPEALAAIRALGQVGGGEAAAALQLELTSPDLDRRRAAARAATHVAGLLEPSAVARLAGDPDEWVRLCAVRVLARRGEVGRALLERLSTSDPSPAVRADAGRLLRHDA